MSRNRSTATRPTDGPFRGESPGKEGWTARRPEEKRTALHGAALALGEALTATLLAAEVERLEAIGRSDEGPPFLVIDAEYDLVLSLPWELLRFGDRWPVYEGQLDLARTISSPGAVELVPPSEPLSLLINVSAPEGAGLDYEAESYRISRALHDHAAVAIDRLVHHSVILEFDVESYRTKRQEEKPAP